MASKKEIDRQKQLQEKFQAILNGLLRDEDNKYCVDCDAKGPRWASWNLGIFLCIRCAGIHRNLGCHISKVKSVNLDTWTADQVESMVEMGNSRARAIYEANIPDGFRRPQTDSTLEAFVRQKYETKKYIAKEWVPSPMPTGKSVLQTIISEEEQERKRTRPRPKNASEPNLQSLATSRPKQHANTLPLKAVTAKQKEENPCDNTDLLGLDDVESSSTVVDAVDDIFGSFSPPMPVVTSEPSSLSLPNTKHSVKSSSTNDLDSLFGTAEQRQDSHSQFDSKPSAKDTIMSLYSNLGNQPQHYGVPGGVYLQPQTFTNGNLMQNGAALPSQAQQFPVSSNPVNMSGPYTQPPSMMGRPGSQNVQYQQQQQQHLQQIQQQLANMKMGNPGTQPVMQNPNWVATGQSGQAVAAGQTLSTNLWQ